MFEKFFGNKRENQRKRQFQEKTFVKKEKEARQNPILAGEHQLAEKYRKPFLSLASELYEKREKGFRLNKEKRAVIALIFLLESTTVMAQKSLSLLTDENIETRYSENLIDSQRKNLFDWNSFRKRLSFSLGFRHDSRYDELGGDESGIIHNYPILSLQNLKEYSPRYIKSILYDFEKISEKESEKITEVAEKYTDAKNFSDFEKMLSEYTDLSDRSKAYILQIFGEKLGEKYDYALLAGGKSKVYDPNEQLAAIQDRSESSGICTNIHVFGARIAKALGLEKVWLQTGYTKNNIGHLIYGTVMNLSGKDEIVFFDYGSFVRSGTMDYQKALGVMERQMGSIKLFDSTLYLPDGNVVSPQSFAQQKLNQSLGMVENPSGLFSKKKEKSVETKISFTISESDKKIKLQNNHLFFTLEKFQNPGNVYNSLDRYDYSTLGYRQNGFEVSAGYLSFDSKGFFDNKNSADFLTFQAQARKTFSSENYSLKNADPENIHNLFYHLNLFAQTLAALPQKNTDQGLQMKTQVFVEPKIIIANPEKNNTFYLSSGAFFKSYLEGAEKQQDSYMTDDIFAKSGLEIVVNEVKFNPELSVHKKSFGEEKDLKISIEGLANKTLSFSYSYKDSQSDYQDLIPDSQTQSLSATYKKDNFSLSMFAQSQDRQYSQADREDYKISLEAKILF